MGERWPAMQARELHAVLVRICGSPTRQSGSHRMFVSPVTGRGFVFAFHDRKELPGGVVRSILVKDVGLDPDEARKELRR